MKFQSYTLEYYQAFDTKGKIWICVIYIPQKCIHIYGTVFSIIIIM